MAPRDSVAFLFPGQGSQRVGMGRDLVEAFPAARAVFAEADEVLGFRLSQLCFEGPEEELRLTANAQPAILATSVAALRCVEAVCEVEPAAVAGHSLGEYTALVAAGSLDFADALRAVRRRGELMQEAVAVGAGKMAAIVGLSAEEVERLCSEAAGAEVVAPANYNGGGQIVIAGHSAAVARAADLARKRGARLVQPLAVSAPFHCSLMQPAAEGMAAHLGAVTVGDPSVPVVSNVEGRPVRAGGRVRELLVRQITSPVQWEACVLSLVQIGCTVAVEIGPGRVLRGLVRRITRDLTCHSAGTAEEVGAVAEMLR